MPELFCGLLECAADEFLRMATGDSMELRVDDAVAFSDLSAGERAELARKGVRS